MSFPVFSVLVIAAGFTALHCIVKNRPGKNPLIINAALAVFSLIFLSLAVEGVFRSFINISDGVGQTLHAKKWVSKYWKPVNGFGLRDVEHTKKSLAGKRIIVVLGDSFTAGYGVKDYRDRFSNLLESRLGDSWTVINMGFPGWNTKDEIKAIRRYPFKPEILILSYLVNDIEGAAEKFGRTFEMPAREPGSPVLGPLVRHSYFVNFFYWRLVRSFKPVEASYFDFLEECFSDERIWAEHAKELENLVSLSRKHGVTMGVVLFPMLIDVESTAPFTAKVADLLRAGDLEVIDLAPRFKGSDRSALMVNAMDGHPNRAVHLEVAGCLIEMIENISAKPVKAAETPQGYGSRLVP